MNITVADNHSPGLIFIAPYQHPGAGPYIYDKHGELVWDGFGAVGPANVHNLHACTYRDSTHLCGYAGNLGLGYGMGHGIVISSDYQTVATVQTGNSAEPADLHEFKLVDHGNAAILTSYGIVPFDWSRYREQYSGDVGDIPYGVGYIMTGSFQEVDVTNGNVLFEWNSERFVDPLEADVLVSNITGAGTSRDTAFDYL